MGTKKGIIKSMYNKSENEFFNIDSNDIEQYRIIESIESENNAKQRAYIQQYFTLLEIETMKYIAQGFKASEIARMQNVQKSSIDRRKERIIEKIYKHIPEMIIDKKQNLTIKNIVFSYHLLEEDETDDMFINRIENFIKIYKNK